MKRDTADNLVWIDLEMTGLNPVKDVVVEIACVITDNNLNSVHEGPSLVIHHDDTTLNTMAPFVRDLHTKSGLVDLIAQSTTTMADAEQQVLDVIKRHCIEKKTLLCGNSIWNDRMFLHNHMPKLESFFHYRMVDVSSIKEMVQRWHADNPHAFFAKGDAHRALDDIKESIAELVHYKKHFFV